MKLILNLKANNLASTLNILIMQTHIHIAFYSEEITIDEILPYNTRLSPAWYEVGQRLGLDSTRLDTIQFAIGSMEGRCQKMLEMWLSLEGPPRRNWETFISALKGGQSTDKLADEIYNQHSIKVLISRL